jgi:hypothetical protein
MNIEKIQADLARLRAENAALREALRNIADRWDVGSPHAVWAAQQADPCSCVVCVARRTLATAEEEL